MNEIIIKKINKTIYETTLDNGLKVIICKTPYFDKKMAFFQTKYGSVDNSFIPIGKKEMKKYPLGIAHFLEHKLFENEEGISYFEEFQNDGAYVNAATSYDKTYYYFVCSENFKENLNRLLDMVQIPYFTDENVEKEKGIIGQEIDMYQNDPDQNLYDKLFFNSFVNDPIRYDIAGSKKDIKKITKDDLYECYNTFYNPCNMTLFVVGDLDEKEVLKIVEENQKNKTFLKLDKIKKEKILEPNEVYKKQETIKRNVSATKIGYSYKIKLEDVSCYESYKRSYFISMFLRSKFGELTNFDEALIKNKYVKSYFNYSSNFSKDYCLIIFEGNIIEDKKVKKLIDEKLKDLSDLEESFNLYKKSILVDYVKMFENPSRICSHLRFMYSKYGKILDNCYEILDKITFKEYYNYIKSLSFDNVSKIVIKRKEEK